MYTFEQAWSVPQGIYYVYTTLERGLGAFRHLFIACFFIFFFLFSLLHVQCASILRLLCGSLSSCWPVYRCPTVGGQPTLVPGSNLVPWVEMKHLPLSCELHKHKSDEDNDRIPGGSTANIAAAAHIAYILTDNCSCVLPVERADLGEIGCC